MNIMDLFTVPMGYLLKWLNALFGNQYLLALFAFAVVVEILLIPFGIMQQKNSIKQARLKPKEMAIRKKYAGRDDRQTQQLLSQEIQEMYQEANTSMFAGCLPLLIQFPILIALYNIVMNPLRYICGLSEDAISQIMTIVKSFPEYADKIKDVTATRTIGLMSYMEAIMETHGSEIFAGVEGFSEMGALPNLVLFGSIDLGEIPSFTNPGWILLIPFLTFAVYYASMKITRKLTFQPSAGANDQAMGCSNKMMDFGMPMMSVFISFGVPAAIGVYWIFKSLLTSLKQFILHKTMPLPKFTEEDYKTAEREVAGRPVKHKEKRSYHSESEGGSTSAAPAKKSENVGAVRSLHHIDDEDFEDTRERAERAKAAREAAEAKKAEERRSRDSKISLEGAPVKSEETLPPEGKKKKGKKGSADSAAVPTEAPTEETPTENGDANSDNNT